MTGLTIMEGRSVFSGLGLTGAGATDGFTFSAFPAVSGFSGLGVACGFPWSTTFLENAALMMAASLSSTLLKFVLLMLCLASSSIISGLLTPYSFAISKIRFFPIQLPPASITRSTFS
jgi:hypothetical protein